MVNRTGDTTGTSTVTFNDGAGRNSDGRSDMCSGGADYVTNDANGDLRTGERRARRSGTVVRRRLGRYRRDVQRDADGSGCDDGDRNGGESPGNDPRYSHTVLQHDTDLDRWGATAPIDDHGAGAPSNLFRMRVTLYDFYHHDAG